MEVVEKEEISDLLDDLLEKKYPIKENSSSPLVIGEDELINDHLDQCLASAQESLVVIKPNEYSLGVKSTENVSTLKVFK